MQMNIAPMDNTINMQKAASQKDKQKHFAVGFAVGIGMTAFLSSKDVGLDIVSAALVSLPAVGVVAFGKEAFDQVGNALGISDHTHGVEIMDALATIGGGVLGAFLAFLFWR